MAEGGLGLTSVDPLAGGATIIMAWLCTDCITFIVVSVHGCVNGCEKGVVADLRFGCGRKENWATHGAALNGKGLLQIATR